MNLQVINFFKEALFRLGTKSPKFFFVLQIFGASLTLAGYIPSMLLRWFNVDVPDHLITMCEDISKYAAGFFLASTFPAISKTVGQTDEGHAIVLTDEKKMPFTSASQMKDIKKDAPPQPVISEVPEPNDN